MTPAVDAAKKAGIQYTLHEYSHDSQASSYGEEAANLLDISPNRVFKTLLIASTDSNQLAVAIVPVSNQLNLKSAAKALGFKKASMADPAEAEKATGYILGGISPLGQKKRLPFVLDETATGFGTIYVSAGKRGLEIELAPGDLIKLCNAKTANIKA
ncbi:Cys-tRNA(Pro) deacylase [Cocleimonas sp. KMM 6892]|uniref:Cys-tRNA(Pro) deacylase n=1 Tax=unclassified Cocleimonas TaxID=2639732 RepID=UPI002DBE2AAA|nr:MULTISPECIES: Cys-tRNA(Pro) deacylase [unclassified Cocleimonas]MEB8431451.1 Cys-tRNA(Pro) deacylase [Cocleimonas sp. KMM 6892]MEC4713777.1 Cys-tRNA(Pro) deacylase [Cocleimonas sp. KMM 6895]MEC4743108.1 Cys-tRNA(Pro) deacylase [Cocleimonas sp. KMM 6896]